MSNKDLKDCIDYLESTKDQYCYDIGLGVDGSMKDAKLVKCSKLLKQLRNE